MPVYTHTNPRRPTKKIIVLGGSGETGQRIVDALTLRYPTLCVASASRQVQPAAEENKFRPKIQLDITDHARTLATLRQYDLVIIATGPMHVLGNHPHRLCIEAGIDCIDINDSLSAADSILSLHDAAIKAQCSVFTGMGFTPGLSSLLLAELASQRASKTGNYKIRTCMGAAYGGGKTSTHAILLSFCKHIETLKDGQRQQICTPWRDGNHSFQFPGQPSAVDTIPFSPLEIASAGTARSVLAGLVSHLDARYHIQYLKQSVARFMAWFEASSSTLDRLAGKMHRSGQKMKRKKDADPDTVLWVYPDDAPQNGLLVHGVLSSYDLTAAMACAVADAWLAGNLDGQHGVYAVDQLQERARTCLKFHLAGRGITSKRANLKRLAAQGLDFGWVAPVASTTDVSVLRHYRCNWYTAAPTHPKMVSAQKRFLLQSEIWSALRKQKKGAAFLAFIAGTLWRWHRHYKQLEAFRRQAQAPLASKWSAITRDISMFTSGYSRARDILGQEQALRLYAKMFLETGRMEMRWLWPDASLFATFDRPSDAARDYWLAFMAGYQELGVLRYSMQGQCLSCTIERCVFSEMLTALGCPELTALVRETEREALEYIASSNELTVDWQTRHGGLAEITLQPLALS